jgi:hypothetical protein
MRPAYPPLCEHLSRLGAGACFRAGAALSPPTAGCCPCSTRLASGRSALLGFAGADDGGAGPARARGGSRAIRCRRGRPSARACSNSARVSAGDTARPLLHVRAGGLVMSGSAITSDTAKRPPGRSTRAASASTLRLSADRLMTQFEMTRRRLCGRVWKVVVVSRGPRAPRRARPCARPPGRSSAWC